MIEQSFGLQSKENREYNEAFDSRIVLRIFRHANKEKALTPEDQERFNELVAEDPNLDKDYWIRLNNEGREQANASSDPSGDIEQSIAFGSPRKRAQEVSLHVMAGQAGVTPDMNFETAKEMVDEDLGMGSKVGSEKRLDFAAQGKTGDAFNQAYMDGRTMEWLVKESDSSAIENKDKITSTYSRMASNVASLVSKYYRTADRWQELVLDSEKKYEKDLKRFLGTHQTVTESFLAKVIEKTKGEDARDKFVEILGGGFGFVEGISVEIKSMGDKKVLSIEYKKDLPNGEKYEFNESVPIEIIEEIIEDGKILEGKI